MAEPFVFHFRPDRHGHPEQMYVHDVWCACGVCGHRQIQRFYHATALHAVSARALDALHRASHQVAAYDCEQCSSRVGALDVEAAVVRFAFADDRGEIVTFARDFGLIDGPRLMHQLHPNRRLDPQVQPSRTPDDASERFEGALSEALVASKLGRPVSFKRAIVELMLDWYQSDELEDIVLIERLAEGFWVVLGDAAPDLLERATRDQRELAAETSPLTWIELTQSSPRALPGYRDLEHLAGRWRRWVPAPFVEALDAGELTVWCGLDAEAASEAFERALTVARLDFERVGETLSSRRYASIRTPRGEGYDHHEVNLTSLLERAAHTGLSAAEAARLTAEEIVGTLLKVWRSV